MHYTRFPRFVAVLYSRLLLRPRSHAFSRVFRHAERKNRRRPAAGGRGREVIHKDIPIVHEWVGTADGLVNATIRAQVTGYLIRQDYTEGDLVKKGQLLFEIDPRPFRAALDQAKGTLAQMEALHENARANLARVKPLAAQNALSKKDLDDAIGAEGSARAQVIAARAAVEKARLDLGFTRITSLIDGMAGIARAQVGDLVGPAVQGGADDRLDDQPDKGLLHHQRTGLHRLHETVLLPRPPVFRRRESCDRTDPGGRVALSPYREILRHRPAGGCADRHAQGGGALSQPANLLRPGQFVRVRVLIGTRQGALLVPQRAVMELQGSYQVAVVGPDNRVDIRPVKPGERVGPLWVIDEGLKPGERVVAEGVQKVKQGNW